MRVTKATATSTARTIVLISIGGIALVGVVSAWFLDQRGVAVAAGVVSVVVILLAKALMEALAQLSQLEGKTAAAHVRVSEHLEEFNSERLAASAESSARVAAMESAVGDQRGFNDGVLRRVRSVESAVGDQRGFNDAAVERVRVLEQRSSALIAALESLQMARDHGIGDHRELHLASALHRLKSQLDV